MLNRNKRIYLLTQFFHSLGFTIPIWIAYYQGFLRPAEISFLVLFQYALQMIMELPSGAMADLLGRKASLLLAFLVGALGFLFLPWATEFWHFLFLAALVGISDSFRSGSEEALIYDTYKQAASPDFDKVYANGNLVYQSGLITGTFTGGFIYHIHPVLPFVLYGFSMLLGLLAAAFYVEPTIDSEKFTLSNYGRQIKSGIKAVFKNKLTTYTSLYYIFVGGITWTNALYFGSYYVVGLGFDETERSFIQGGIRLANALAITFVLSKIKLSERTRILFFPVAMIIGFLPGAWVAGWAGVSIYILTSLSATSRWIFLTPITNQAFESKLRATAISVLSLMVGFVYVGLVGLSAIVLEKSNIGVMYTILGVFTVITVLPLSIVLLKLKGSGSNQQ